MTSPSSSSVSSAAPFFFEFIPQFKLVVAGNHKPSIRTIDEATALSAALYASWKAWAEAAGEFIGSQRRLSDLLIARGFAKCRHAHEGARAFQGLKVRDETRSPTDLEF